MKVNEVRCYPYQQYRLVSMHHDGKTYAYSQVNGCETFEVCFNKNGRPEEGHYYSRAYRLEKGQKVPQSHVNEFEFLKSEFDKVDWETLYITNSLTGQYTL